MTNAKRGEVWLVDLNPTRGQELQKTRPVIIISSDLFDLISLKIAIPVTSWQDKFRERPFMVRIDANPDNRLDRDSAGNILQVRSLSTDRFVKRLGQMSTEVLQELLSGLIVRTDYELKS
ncbi:type II toxin-antitoxin system PemK/MazF family toxin [Chamaesiphon sp.]|uniref:type II toxin-antitoxin system PemK/MazF family toxin n=1 Tax=Chamaesiphon sp. TaxID=2814140 RepID=UPI003593A207